MNPFLIDLYCKAGGAADGYHAEGFDILGVDIEPQPRYPYPFYQADALLFLAQVILNEGWISHGGYHRRIDAFHASPPCQAHSDLRHRTGREYPELIGPTRERLQVLAAYYGTPWVIENVEGAPLRNPIMLCGTMFPDLRVIRHRLFESNIPLVAPEHRTPHPLVYTKDKRKAHYGRLDESVDFVSVNGGGNCSREAAADAMGLARRYLTKDELNQAIPPAYTRLVGAQLLTMLNRRQVA